MKPDHTATTGQHFIPAQVRINKDGIAQERARVRIHAYLWLLLFGAFIALMGLIGYAGTHPGYTFNECFTVNKGEIVCTLRK